MVEAAKTSSVKENINRTITVAVTERKPFVTFNQNGMPMGLDALIIGNFAQEFNLHVEYSIVNSSRNLIFNGNLSISLHNDTILRYFV